MQTYSYVASACLALISLVPGTAAVATNSSPIPEASETSLVPSVPKSSQTLLRFETQHYIVRVYRRQALTFLNVYNKETGFTDQNGVRAHSFLPESTEDPWRTFVSQGGDLQYIARVNPAGMTELEIRVAGDSPTQPEIGYNASYSFPHMYLGHSIDAILPELEASGWTLDSTHTGSIALMRDQLALTITFDPRTRSITHTQLVKRA